MTAPMRVFLTSLLMLIFLSGCGFKPLYATTENGGGVRSLANVHVVSLTGSGDVNRFVDRALSQRVSRSPGSADYDLVISTNASARRLAVQIDASVTRFNYNLNARYRLIHRGTGKAINGNAAAVTSYNIVASQYSTLFAENAAREKAAAQLVDEIERDILLRLRDKEDDKEAREKSKS